MGIHVLHIVAAVGVGGSSSIRSEQVLGTCTAIHSEWVHLMRGAIRGVVALPTISTWNLFDEPNEWRIRYSAAYGMGGWVDSG